MCSYKCMFKNHLLKRAWVSPILARNLYSKPCIKITGQNNIFQNMSQTITLGSSQTMENSEFLLQMLLKCVGLTKLPFCHQPCHGNLQQRLLGLQIWYSQPCQGGFIKAFVPHMERIYSSYWSLHYHLKIAGANTGRLTWWREQYRAKKRNRSETAI